MVAGFRTDFFAASCTAREFLQCELPPSPEPGLAGNDANVPMTRVLLESFRLHRPLDGIGRDRLRMFLPQKRVRGSLHLVIRLCFDFKPYWFHAIEACRQDVDSLRWWWPPHGHPGLRRP